LQFGERENPQTRRCQISLEWTVERLCELVHRKYVKKIPGNQMEVVLHRTYTVMEQTRRLHSYNIRAGERMVIRRSCLSAQPSFLDEAFCENLPYARPLKRRPSLVTSTPNQHKIVCQRHMLMTSAVKGSRSQYPKRMPSPSSCNLSPISGDSKSYSDKMRKQPGSTKRSISMDDEKDSSKESSVGLINLQEETNSKSVLEKMEHGGYLSVKLQHPKSLPKQMKRTKSLINPKLKPR